MPPGRKRIFRTTCVRHPEEPLAPSSRTYCRECIREYKRNSPTNHRRVRYGLDGEDVELMRLIQGNACDICRQPLSTRSRRREHVDHDHQTGLVRGLLCGSCNTGLGCYRDDPALLASAIAYLGRWDQQSPSDPAAHTSVSNSTGRSESPDPVAP